MAAGGRLVSEAAPGAYDERGWHRSEAPPATLRRLFGVRSIETDAVPGEIAFAIGQSRLSGAWMREAIELAGAKKIGFFDDGEVAATSHKFRRAGEAIWIGACPSVGYHLRRDASTRAAIASLLPCTASLVSARWSGSRHPGLMLRPTILPDGAGISSIRPQLDGSKFDHFSIVIVDRQEHWLSVETKVEFAHQQQWRALAEFEPLSQGCIRGHRRHAQFAVRRRQPKTLLQERVERAASKRFPGRQNFSGSSSTIYSFDTANGRSPMRRTVETQPTLVALGGSL